jgi:hypothetical protein
MSLTKWFQHPVTAGAALKDVKVKPREEQEEHHVQGGGTLATLPPRPKPVARAATPMPSAYEQLAAELDFLPDELLNQQIGNFLVEQQIPIYNYKAVCKYMTAIAVSNGANFFWRPLRRKDKEIFGGWHWGRGQKHGYYQSIDSVCRPYDKLVPAHILNDVKIIQDRFGPQVAFFVSDYKASSPDPFILVTAPRIEVDLWVFGAWDEPGFGVI